MSSTTRPPSSSHPQVGNYIKTSPTITGGRNLDYLFCQRTRPKISSTNTIYFIHPTSIPTNKAITYGRIVVDIKPNKQETHRTRLTVGGNRLEYFVATYNPTADITTIKILLNSIISTPRAFTSILIYPNQNTSNYLSPSSHKKSLPFII